MPYRYSKSYKPPLFLFNKHLETIYPALFRKVEFILPERKREELADGDFLDLDWYQQKSNRLIVINHGLEASSDRPYMLGMAKRFYSKGWDILSWNFRGCGGQLNRLPRFYHSGETNDLRYLLEKYHKYYEEIILIGFSLGANMMLKYIGEESSQINSKIKGAVAFSVPLHLESSCEVIMSKSNYVYQKRFLDSLKNKVLAKEEILKDLIDLDRVMASRTITDFDDSITAPLHGFKDAHDYYEKNSALRFLDKIKIPTLIVNSENDPMLSKLCYPEKMSRNHNYVHFEKWKNGGHVGYYSKGDYYQSEIRALDFTKDTIGINQT